MVILVFDKATLDDQDKNSIIELKGMEIPFLIVFNKADLYELKAETLKYLDDEELAYISVTSSNRDDMIDLREKLIDLVPEYFKKEPVIIGDIINKGDIVVLIIPIDLEAPRGRIILPQMQVLREVLDRRCSFYNFLDCFCSLQSRPWHIVGRS